jgi:hypothetical protein
MVASYDRSHDWAADGFVNAASALRARCNVTPGGASASVHLARKLEQLPATSAAFGRGEISRQHAAAIEAQHARRRLHLSQTLGDMGVLDGAFDAEGTEVGATALTAEMERDRLKGDMRTRPQRRADALVNICRRALDSGSVGSSRNARQHVTVVVDLAELPAGPGRPCPRRGRPRWSTLTRDVGPADL